MESESSKLRKMVESLTIQTKKIDTARLRLNWAQSLMLAEVERQLNTTGRVRIIVLKARQIGISTLTEALAFTFCFLWDKYRVTIIAHDSDSTEGLLGMTNLYWETCMWHDAFNTRHLSTTHIKWKETGSSLKVATAGSKEAGRSKTIHFLHASEYAFWSNPGRTMLGLKNAMPNVPGTCAIIESTANGIGNEFHTLWEDSKAGETEYTPMFFPWHKHPEYLASEIGIPYATLGVLTEEERALRAMGIDDNRLAWRRWAIRNNCENNVERFHQEYPVDDIEAFVATGQNVFPLDYIRACYQPMAGIRGRLIREHNGKRVDFVRDPTGPLTIFRYPHPDPSWGQYHIGADPTRTTKGDYACAQVLNRHTLEQVAMYRWKLDAGTYAEELWKLGTYYNDAGIAPEKEGPGQLTVGKLLGMNYPNVWHHTKIDRTPGKEAGDTWGWSTTMQTKQLAIGYLLNTLVEGAQLSGSGRGFIFHDPNTFNELKNYTQYDNGEYGPADAEKGHDDTVMALAIGITTHHMTMPPLPYGSELPASADGQDEDDSADVGLGTLDGLLPWEHWETDEGVSA